MICVLLIVYSQEVVMESRLFAITQGDKVDDSKGI